MARSQVHLALPDDLLAQVKEVAARDGRTVTSYLTGLIQAAPAMSVVPSTSEPKPPMLQIRVVVFHRLGHLNRG